MIFLALAKVTYGEDQTVIELKKTVANLNDVKMYLKVSRVCLIQYH